jgi:competence protein ComEC
VGVLAGWIVLLARLVGVRGRAWLYACGFAWCYVALLGFPAPATRAASFITIIGVSRARQRHPPPSAVLAVAILLVLAVDPTAATSVGAWLSAAAVWGTRAGSALVPRFRLLGASLGATLATAPITAWVFGSVAPVGVAANLVAVPLAGILVPGLFISLILGGILAGGTGLVLVAIEGVAGIAARIPGGHITGPAATLFAAPWLLLLVTAVWIRAQRLPRAGVLRKLLAAAALASWAWFAVTALPARRATDDLVLYFLAVGQGDAIAVKTPRGAWMLVDGGPRMAGFDAGSRLVVPFLRHQGVTQLDAVLVSHGDADHLGGIPAVVRSLAPDLVLDPGQPLGTGLYLEYLQALDATGTEWKPARSGDKFTLDSVTVTVLHPSNEWVERQLIPNENSLVLRMEYGCFSAIFTGDIGLETESTLAAELGAADLLKVAHHGSASSTGRSFLGAVQPQVAVISVGNNNFGHPAEAVLRRLESHNVRLFRTDQGGMVTVRTDGRYFHVDQGETKTLTEALGCLIQPLLRLRGSSSNKRDCTRTPAVTLPSCSTTLR